MKKLNNTSLFVIGSYPEKNATHGKSTVGVASYTKNTLLNLSKSVAITVLAEELNGKKTSYQEQDIQVKRVWKRNNLGSYLTLLQTAVAAKTKEVLIPFELAMFGETLSMLPFPFFVLLLRLFGKRVTIIIHQVISDIGELSGHIYTYNRVQRAVLNFCLRAFYKLLVASASKVIVMDKVFADRLGNIKKAVVIPHGVETFRTKLSKEAARKKLGIPQNKFVVLYFGFLAHYKGADWLVDQFKNVSTPSDTFGTSSTFDTLLIMAGGPNPNHVDKKPYMNYIKQIEQTAKANGTVVTGFVPEEDIETYFQAADIVVFPYRTLMSASGPLSMAFSFGKPFLVSKKLQPIFETADIKRLLKTAKIQPNTFIFGFSDSLSEKLKYLQRNTKSLEHLSEFSKQISNLRNFKIIGNKYYETIFS